LKNLVTEMEEDTEASNQTEVRASSRSIEAGTGIRMFCQEGV